VVTNADVAHALGAFEMIAIIAPTAGVSAVLITRHIRIKLAITAEAHIGYTGATLHMEAVITARAEGLTICRAERTNGADTLLADTLEGEALPII
jgi:hypothetical protein